MAPLATIGILSMGDMGAGIARLLVARGFAVVTNCAGRSPDTVARAEAAGAALLPTDAALVRASDVLLSVVPPRDAAATAQRVVDALGAGAGAEGEGEGGGGAGPRATPLYFADMNAVAPSTARRLAGLFEAAGAPVRFVDGCILGGPPARRAAGGGEGGAEAEEWDVPLMPTSGPHRLADLPFGAALAAALGSRHMGDAVGAASGLKMCFASLTKGYTAIAVQAYATAARLGVLADLRAALEALIPGRARQAEAGLASMPPKAYRWVAEMEEIGRTHADEAGFAADPSIFAGAAEVYRAVAEDTVLGLEKVGARKRGRTAEDVAEAVVEGLQRKRSKRAD